MLHSYKFSGLLVKFLIDPEICNIQVRIENALGVCVPQRSLKKFMSQIKIHNVLQHELMN